MDRALFLYNFKLKNLRIILDREDSIRVIAHYHSYVVSGPILVSLVFFSKGAKRAVSSSISLVF